MKKCKLIFIISLLLGVIICIYYFFFVEYPDDIDTLYSVKFGSEKIRFERIDTAIGQKQIVVVQKSMNNGKTFVTVTEQPIILSMEPKLVFFSSKFGIAISKPYIEESNDYMGVFVTHDGGKTFKNSKILHFDPYVDNYEISGLPYLKNEVLYLPCSFYTIKDEQSGYEIIDTFFVSDDYGLTWNINKRDDSLNMLLNNESLSANNAIFYLKNGTNSEYTYNSEYYISKKTNDKWVDVALKPEFKWNDDINVLIPLHQNEIHIDWSLSYGKLDKGEYRIVKQLYKSGDNANNRIEIVYSYFEIK